MNWDKIGLAFGAAIFIMFAWTLLTWGEAAAQQTIQVCTPGQGCTIIVCTGSTCIK